jgi:hypothetical protein
MNSPPKDGEFTLMVLIAKCGKWFKNDWIRFQIFASPDAAFVSGNAPIRAKNKNFSTSLN